MRYSRRLQLERISAIICIPADRGPRSSVRARQEKSNKVHTQNQISWNGRRKRVSPGLDLFSIDAGDAPASIRFGVKHKKVNYELTEKDLAEQAKYS